MTEPLAGLEAIPSRTDLDRARAIAALGVAQAELARSGRHGVFNLEPLQASLAAVIDGAGPDGSAMVPWQLTGDPSGLAAGTASALADLWATQSDRLRRRVRPEDPRPLRLELILSTFSARSSVWLAGQLQAAAPSPVGVHVREHRPDLTPRWHWPLRIRFLEDPDSTTFANEIQKEHWVREGLATVVVGGYARTPAELLLLPWSLRDAALGIAGGSLPFSSACVVALGGGAEGGTTGVDDLKNVILDETGASGLFVTSLDPAAAARWLNDAVLENLAHNYQLDVCLGLAPSGVFFATPALLEVSQLANQILAIADEFERLPGNPILGVPPGLEVPAGPLPARELAQRIRARAPLYRYDHESDQASAFARAGGVLDAALEEARSHLQAANGGGGGEGAGEGEDAREGTGADEESLAGGPIGEDRELRIEAPARSRRHPARVVSTGFAAPDQPRAPLDRRRPLAVGQDNLYWIEIGRPVRGAIDTSRVEVLPEEVLPPGSRFQVALFTSPGGLALDPKASVGEFVLAADGTFHVAVDPAGIDDPRRMFFPVRTPARGGRYRLRCSIYFRNVLVQSRIVTASVGLAPKRGIALSARVDVQVARLFSGTELADLEPHIVSVHLNANGDDAQSVRFFAEFDDGRPAFTSDASFEALALEDLITQARETLRQISWGSDKPWSADGGMTFRYRSAAPDLAADLFELMRKGRQLYDAMINDFANGPVGAVALRKLMLAPGRVQIVNSGPASELIPTAMIYDYPNARWEIGGLSLCPAFVAARASGDPLEAAPCFQGKCPSLATPQVVCPSGFWGFRHAIGVRVRSKWGPKPPTASEFTGNPRLGFAIDPEFDLIAGHQQAVAGDQPAWDVVNPVAATYQGTLELLAARPHVVYFYCHGGVAKRVPYLQVGPKGQPMISAPALRSDDEDLYRLPRSLVILNGCETANLEPATAMSLVASFIDNVAAAGVIGTEVTVYEELAVRFGEALLHNIRSGLEVGESVRRARLALLRDGNPLGLVYLPLVAAETKLVAQANPVH